jgi:type I restriction-modification system DNA methylase subunit
MILNRQVVLKAVVTPQLKESLIAEVQEAIARVNETQDQLEVQSRRVMLELQRTDLNRAMAFRQQLDAEKRKHTDLKEELDEWLKEYQELEMGTEFVRGVLEGTVEVSQGDNLREKLGQAEILTEDDLIKEIRDPAA